MKVSYYMESDWVTVRVLNPGMFVAKDTRIAMDQNKTLVADLPRMIPSQEEYEKLLSLGATA